MNPIPFLDSQVIRALLVALVGMAGLIARKMGASFDDAFWNELIDAALLVIATGGSLWAGWARATKPTPPITQTAAEKTAERERQGGFARLPMLLCLLIGALAAVAGCSGTRDAYRAASDAEHVTRLEATAYVVSEHYAALVAEAARLKNTGALSGDALERVRLADDAVRPLIIGDASTQRPGVVQAVAAYRALRNAETEAQLQQAISAAVVQLSALITALKGR